MHTQRRLLRRSGVEFERTGSWQPAARAAARAERAAMGEELNFGDLLAGLLGGVALLLFGMGRITDAMKLIAGERLKVPSRTSAFCGVS